MTRVAAGHPHRDAVRGGSGRCAPPPRPAPQTTAGREACLARAAVPDQDVQGFLGVRGPAGARTAPCLVRLRKRGMALEHRPDTPDLALCRAGPPKNDAVRVSDGHHGRREPCCRPAVPAAPPPHRGRDRSFGIAALRKLARPSRRHEASCGRRARARAFHDAALGVTLNVCARRGP